MNRKEYLKKQRKLRILFNIYSSSLFSSPRLYKIRNRVYSKHFNAGRNLKVEAKVHISRTHGFEGYIKIGNNVVLSRGSSLDFSGSLIIDDNVTISEEVIIYSHKHDIKKLSKRDIKSAIKKNTRIKEGVWIGARSIILPGITIGEYAVIAAGSVVTKDVEPFTMVGGNPAQVIRKIDDHNE